MVEFVLIAPLLFLLVGGIVQMALALNYWLDMQRIANQGARWAVVARYPPPGTEPICDSRQLLARLPSDQLPQCSGRGAVGRPETGRLHLVPLPTEAGPGSNVGEPVRIRLESGFTFVPILGIGTLTLGADAEMRIEQQRGSVYGPTPEC